MGNYLWKQPLQTICEHPFSSVVNTALYTGSYLAGSAYALWFFIGETFFVGLHKVFYRKESLGIEDLCNCIALYLEGLVGKYVVSPCRSWVINNCRCDLVPPLLQWIAEVNVLKNVKEFTTPPKKKKQ